ncbi:MAG: allantoate amidohydrolase [Methylobacterium sp.]|nr:MAG: allantoate amidohydrolase [Methylobacterium sp.]
MSAFMLPSPTDLGAAVLARLDELAAISDEPGKITRLYLSKSHRRAATLVEGWMRDAGMSVTLDPLASLIGTYPGTDPDAPHLLLGSHIDSVRDAGKYDGTLGVAAAIEIVRHLNAGGHRLPFGLTVLAFGDEEGVRFPSTLSGSAALAGRFNPAILDETDEDGITRRAALAEFGAPPGDPAAAWQGQNALGYLELHIEQGPVLEAENRPLGLVTAIQGVTRGACRVIGSAGHAGTVPMALRRDALAAASEMVLAVERIGRETEGLVATIGQLRVPGGAVNTIPGSVEFSLDFRSEIDAVRKDAEMRIRKAIETIAANRKVEARLTYGYEAPASECDPGLRLLMAEAAESVVQKPIRLLPSGAGHDAMSFRGKLPFMMLFVRSKAGISHSPDEFTSEADLGLATATLFRAVLDLAKKHA